MVQLSVLLHYLLSYMFRPYKAIIRLVYYYYYYYTSLMMTL